MEGNIGQMLGLIAVALATWILGAVIVVGLMQTLKKAIPWLGKDETASWIKTVIAVVVGIGVGLARYSMVEAKPEEGVIWTCLGIIAISQTCYEAIYRGILKRGEKFADGEPPAASSSPAPAKDGL